MFSWRQTRFRQAIAATSLVAAVAGCRSATTQAVSPGGEGLGPATLASSVSSGSSQRAVPEPIGARRSPDAGNSQPDAIPLASVQPTTQTAGVVPAEDYGKWLKEANRRHHLKDYTGAIEAFKKALLARPESAEAMAQLGWAAYLAHDLMLSESWTRAALKASVNGDKSLRGAAFYNLGVVLQESGNKPGAVEAYASSFAERPSTAARKRLTQLDAIAAEVALAIHATVLADPTPTLASFCEGDVTSCFIPGSLKFSDQSLAGPNALGPRGPYKGVAVVGSRSGPYGTHSLAIRTSSGWYRRELFSSNMGVSGAWTGGGEVESLEYRDVIAGEPTEILLTCTYAGATGGAIEPSESSTTSHRSLIVCGLSSQGVPACTKPITLELTETKVEVETTSYSLNVGFSGPHWLVLTHAEGTLPDSVRAQLGKRRLVLP